MLTIENENDNNQLDQDFKFTQIDHSSNIPIANMIAFYLTMRGQAFDDPEKSEFYVMEKYRRWIMSSNREEWLWGLHPIRLRACFNLLATIRYEFNEQEKKYLIESGIVGEIEFDMYFLMRGLINEK